MDGTTNHQKVKFILMDEKTAPTQAQKKADPAQFFADWVVILRNMLGEDTSLVLVGSEPYCIPLAEGLQVPFIPYDMGRSLNSARGTDVRTSMDQHWEDLLPAMRRQYGTTITMFGQESVGKTVISRELGLLDEFTMMEEYARPYLEAVGAELNPQKMQTIWWGQASWQALAQEHPRHPILVQDTDLYTTVGYYRLLELPMPEGLLRDARELRSDLYFILPDEGVPLTPDPLRYGDGVRETSRDYWTLLCTEFDLPYILVPAGTVEEKTQFIEGCTRRYRHEQLTQVREFQRTNRDTPPV